MLQSIQNLFDFLLLQVVRMFIIIVTIFALCWLPYQLFFIFAYHNKQISSAPYVQHLYLGFYWFAMSNAMVNPIIYYWMNGRLVSNNIHGNLIALVFDCLNIFKHTYISWKIHNILCFSRMEFNHPYYLSSSPIHHHHHDIFGSYAKKK